MVQELATLRGPHSIRLADAGPEPTVRPDVAGNQFQEVESYVERN
jgi:hypothetical protein